MSMRAIGIYREREFSPGKIEADAAILDAVLADLRRAGFDTEAIDSGSLARTTAARADLVLAMCQGEGALRKLALIESAGALVINSPEAIRNCYRDRLGDMLAGARVPIPPGILVSSRAAAIDAPRPRPQLPAAGASWENSPRDSFANRAADDGAECVGPFPAPSPSRHDCCEKACPERSRRNRNNRAALPSPKGRGAYPEARPLDLADVPKILADDVLDVLDLCRPLYVKRGDLHALSANDVVRVGGAAELRPALQNFARRGIGLAYVQQAVEGTVVKFYGVSGRRFFRALPERGDLSNAVSERLHAIVSLAADALGLEVWGGDAVIEGGDRVLIIDFNDWPSYSRVRDEAAAAIAERAVALLRDHQNLWRVDASGEKA
jgi:hypothetical protein